MPELRQHMQPYFGHIVHMSYDKNLIESTHGQTNIEPLLQFMHITALGTNQACVVKEIDVLFGTIMFVLEVGTCRSYSA